MTKARALYILREYRRRVIRNEPHHFNYPRHDPWYRDWIYEMGLVEELIARVKCSDRPPMDVIGDFYRMLDDVLAESDDDHILTHQFAAKMEFNCGIILRYMKHLGEKEEAYEEHEGIRGTAEAEVPGNSDGRWHHGHARHGGVGGAGHAEGAAKDSRQEEGIERRKADRGADR